MGAGTTLRLKNVGHHVIVDLLGSCQVGRWTYSAVLQCCVLG